MLNNKAIKLSLFLLFVGISTLLSAQNSIENPYSRFGLGEMSYSYNHPYNGSMGGVSYTLQRNNSINPFNPASYAGIDTLSFVFDIGVTAENYTLKNSIDKTSGFQGNLSHIMFGFAAFKWWKTSLGLLPMSTVSYSSNQIKETDFGEKTKSQFSGDGGLTKIYWGNSFSPIKNLSIGFNINFLFGNASYMTTTSLLDSAGNNAKDALSSRFSKKIYVADFTGDVGVQYFIPIKEKYRLGLGATYSIPNSFNVDNEMFNYTLSSTVSGDYMMDTVSYSDKDSKVKLPQAFGLGVSFEEPKKWYVATDITYTDWNSFVFADQKNASNNNTWRFSLGGEYIPNYLSRSYLDRMTFRAGLHYEPNKLMITNQDGGEHGVSDMGVHIGIGFPTRKMRSVINLSLEYGVYGTTDYNLVQKNYFKIGLSLSTADIWFLKHKYD